MDLIIVFPLLRKKLKPFKIKTLRKKSSNKISNNVTANLSSTPCKNEKCLYLILKILNNYQFDFSKVFNGFKVLGTF